ncbi:bifunctional alpha/beta hydrolase/OsmC family protein [Aliiroseovarius sp. KMU-50]|uniref:Bifunctional alpha/beta hydrolase/OsmC family protein n=1 Tax=Aliiroseovarius salicola TaxID=3009082 RepID=A0ABT4W1J6_9RHOB|nr:bifunctional alpha/beta hydrolase/OsmC family protein [Aliiroseovarius sp. KMU-50]MDA5094379.1 bifunctional alpha/beta hydrolase/OsmC family protein [Aliiroseovarius sp. KMU-50]
MPIERFTFKGHGGHDLAARLDRPSGPHLATALFAHCFTCGKDIIAARRIADRLTGAGIAVLRFDFTGLGHSDGEFENTDFTSNVEDLLLAAAALEARGLRPSLLIGHSLGGAAVLKAASSLPSALAVVTIGTPSTPANVVHQFSGSLDDISDQGQAEVQLGGRPFTIRQSFVDDVQDQKLEDAIRNLNAALLVLHAPRDQVVSIEHAAKIFLAAKHPKSFVTLDNADHLITRPDDAEYVADVIATWAARYLDLAPPAPPIGAPEGIVRVTEADPNGFLQDVQSGPFHHTQADEPMAYGGTNKGMSPYGYLSAGLGACTSMTIRMYARRKGWPLQHVRVDVSHNKVHAQDAETGTRAKIDTFRREIFLEGPLSEEQRTRLLEVADKCPVHRTLEGTSEVKTILVDC